MSVAAVPDRPASTATELPIYRLSVAQYHALADHGILWEDCPVELLEGLLVEKHRGPRTDDPIVAGGQWPLFRLRVEDYDAMRRHGVLGEDAPVEFIEGLLIETMVRRPPHDTAMGLLQDHIGKLLPPGWILRVQSAITLTDSEPEPDIAVVRGDRRDFANQHPTADVCGLVIEVAESSLPVDRGPKRSTYARHSISAYWIVNLVDGVIEVCADPSGLVARTHFRSIQTYSNGDTVPIHLDGVQIGRIAADDVLL
jgi:Uma2 family endonuclease